MTRAKEKQLDALLREAFNPVADDGFSARVVAALPGRRTRRHWLMPSAAGAGMLLTWISVGRSELWQRAAVEWTAGQPAGALLAVVVLGLFAAILSSAWALVEAD